MNPNKISAYSSSGHRQVDGWLADIAIPGIRSVAGYQQASKVAGSICEIGVHHGRLFILLHLLSNENETSIAYDLFERQRENVDNSGAGAIDIFLANCKKHSGSLSRIKPVTANSMELTPASIVDTGGARCRLFSVDGGHTAEITENDLNLAANSLTDGGVAILDDFFNEAWPGVAEGAMGYFIKHPGALIPFAIMGNKILFTTSNAWAARYRAQLQRDLALPSYHSKITQFLGSDVLVCWAKYSSFKQKLAGKLTAIPGWQQFSTTAAWRFIKPAVKRIFQ